MQAALTAEFLRQLPTTPCEIWDTKLPGFYIRVRPSGRAYWAVTIGRGKGGKTTLGRVDVITAVKARTLAQSVIGQAARDKALGVDPRTALATRLAKSTSSTLDEFLERKYLPWATANRKTGEETVARIKSAFGPAFLKRPMQDLTT